MCGHNDAALATLRPAQVTGALPCGRKCPDTAGVLEL